MSGIGAIKLKTLMPITIYDCKCKENKMLMPLNGVNKAGFRALVKMFNSLTGVVCMN